MLGIILRWTASHLGVNRNIILLVASCYSTETEGAFHDAGPTGQIPVGLSEENCNAVFRLSPANLEEYMAPAIFHSFPEFPK